MAATVLAVVFFATAIMVWSIKYRSLGMFAYDQRGALVSRAELVAFNYLRDEVGHHGHVCPKVRVADLLNPRVNELDEHEQRKAFWKIAQKHVDFVIVDQVGMPRFAVEIDDSSHNRRDRRERDIFLNNAFVEADLPLVRVKVNQHRKNRALANAIAELTGERDEPA